ncbi:uncharacterized protein N7496_008609 [Penicillium cataractarum]|uniref:Uncharacterized protein n=1 Tax=Penicillium cataractarum TaxID=2100454 RepID=A0A9W9S0K5_9EURO|nr:uncharacterized protein N7496_008609 [Penicillium cataractarum]KAJ5368849.1 hypothetical protein N7496_008609 [Penicillium cataractarum]
MTFQLPSRNNYHHLDDAPNDNPYDINSRPCHSHTDSDIPEQPLQTQHIQTDSITQYTNEKLIDPAQTTLLNKHNYDHDPFKTTRPLQAHLTPSDPESYFSPPATHSAPNSPFLSPAERLERALADSEKDDYVRIRPKGFRMFSLANMKTEWYHGSRGRVLKYWIGFPLLGVVVIVVVVIIVLAILGFSKIGFPQ